MDDVNLRRLAALAEMALEDADLFVLGPRIVEVVEDLLPATAASLLLWDPAEQAFTVSHSTLPGQQPGHVLRTIRRSGGASRHILDHQEPVVVGDVDADPYGGNRLLREAGLRSYLGVPLVFEGASIGVLYALDRSTRDYSAADVDFMTILARRAAGAVGIARLIARLDDLARTDALTGLDNRREFMTQGTIEFARELRANRPLSAVIIDIDHFKDLNDTYGHAVGDVVLTEVADRIRGQLRDFDLVGRIGGEEFAVLLPVVTAGVAARIAGRITHAISDAPVITDAGPVRVTVTAGVAERAPNTATLAMLLERADAALYDGKAAGRNRVTVLDDSGPIRRGTTSLADPGDHVEHGDADTESSPGSAEQRR